MPSVVHHGIARRAIVSDRFEQRRVEGTYSSAAAANVFRGRFVGTIAEHEPQEDYDVILADYWLRWSEFRRR